MLSMRVLNHCLTLAMVQGVVFQGTMAMAAPFTPNPVSFAGFANETFRRQGRDLYVKNLNLCGREGKEGYKCLAGEVLQGTPARHGREFCQVDALWYVPFSRTVQIRTRKGSCQFRSDQQRLLDQGQQWLRQGLDRLEKAAP